MDSNHFVFLSNYYFWSAVVNAVTSFLVTCLVFVKNRKNKTNQIFIIFSGSVGFWALCYSIWVACMSGDSAQNALFWIRLAMIGSTVIPPAFTEFVIHLLSLENYWRRVRILNLLMMGAVLFFSFSPLFINSVIPILSFKYWPSPGPLFYVFHLWFGGNFIVSHYLLIRVLMATERTIIWKRNLNVFIGTFIGFLGGMTNHFLWYGIKIPPVGNILVAVYVATVAFSIIRYRFLDIQVIIKRTLVFTGLFAMVMGVVTLMTLLTQRFIGRYADISPFMATTLSVLAAIFLYDPTRKFLVFATDRYLFQKKEDLRVILNRLSEKVVTILDVEELGKTILSTLETSLRLESGAILMRDEEGGRFEVLDSFGNVLKNLYFEKEDPFVQFFYQSSGILNLEDSARLAQLPLHLRSLMDGFKAHVCLPLFLTGELTGLLILGKKKSDQEFTPEELAYFPTLGTQVAIALNYVRAIDILKKSQAEFVQQAKMAAIGTLSSGISHELKNPLNNIQGIAEVTLLNIKDGHLKVKSAEDYQRNLTQILESILEDVHRASEIMTALSQIAHKERSAELKKEPVELPKQVDAVYVLLKTDLRHSNITFEKEFPPAFPSVWGDRARITEVLLNLINNARQAIGKGGFIRIWGEVKDSIVSLHVTDTGPGMTPEIQAKIFDPFFTTKKQGEGTGLGLHISRVIMNQMGAKISVQSTLGKGTTFTLEFPQEMSNIQKSA